MIPSIPIRIDNLLKAMEIVIVPSIEEEATLAREQATLLIKHLRIIGAQWDTAYLFERGSLDEMIGLATELSQLADGGDIVQAATVNLQAILAEFGEVHLNTTQEVTHELVKIGDGVEELINACYAEGSNHVKMLLLSTVLEYGKRQSYRERVWFKAAGMDPEVTELGEVRDVLWRTGR